MRNSIAHLKENLNKITLDVHDSDEEHEINRQYEGHWVSDRKNSHSLAHSNSDLRSHGVMGSPYTSEIVQYKEEIKKLQGSEAEIKALSVNYAALLKEKEDQVFKLNEENGILKQNLDAANFTLNLRSDGFKTSENNQYLLTGNDKHSPNRHGKSTTQIKRSTGNQIQNGVVTKQDGLSNGVINAVHPFTVRNGIEKDFADMLEEKTKTLDAVQARYESEIKEVRLELENEHSKTANLQLKLRDELNMQESFQEELRALRSDKENACTKMEKLSNELNEKLSEISHLQLELCRKNNVDADDAVEGLKRVIATLEKDNANLKAEKDKNEAASMANRSSLDEKVDSIEGFPPENKELELTVQKLDKGLIEAREERDKALQQLSRLKQHLLDKESEESDKMDEDSKIIEELRSNSRQLRDQISQLERALKQAIANQEEVKIANRRELQMSTDIINDLNNKLSRCLNTIDSKNVELVNLQTALGQYYAEIEAKEYLEKEYLLAREDSARLSKLLKDADQQLDISKREKEEIMIKLSQTERILAEAKSRLSKLEQDNLKLRKAFEQSMTRINRMSMDSDYFVDRRIVIKLLVTYFERNHSKEILELMVRMLGFSEEERQRIGVAQEGVGKGVVRGVLGFPGRLVGGILSGSSSESHSHATSQNQSFADLWVDFLVKETEERERMAAMGEVSNAKSTHSKPEFSTVSLNSSQI